MKNILIIIFSTVLFTSCGIFKHTGNNKGDIVERDTVVTKKVETKTPTMLLLDSVTSLVPQKEYIRYHFKGNYKSENQELPIKGICAIRKDSAVWLSLRPGLGIEIARVYFMKDSLFIIDRIQSNYYAHSYKDFENLAVQQLNYEFFESLFSARSLVFNNDDETPGKHYEHSVKEGTISFLRLWNNNSKHELMLYPNGFIKKNSIVDTKNKFSFISNYSYLDYTKDLFPKDIIVDIFTNTKMNAIFKISNYSNKVITIPKLKIPDYYSKKVLNFNK